MAVLPWLLWETFWTLQALPDIELSLWLWLLKLCNGWPPLTLVRTTLHIPSYGRSRTLIPAVTNLRAPHLLCSLVPVGGGHDQLLPLLSVVHELLPGQRHILRNGSNQLPVVVLLLKHGLCPLSHRDYAEVSFLGNKMCKIVKFWGWYSSIFDQQCKILFYEKNNQNMGWIFFLHIYAASGGWNIKPVLETKKNLSTLLKGKKIPAK